jgi:hypothetical protein
MGTTPEPEFLNIFNDSWAESVSARFSNISADILNIKCKCR